MRILHTESSTGWGGQEIRILREAEGMRARGHHLVFAIVRGGTLAQKARERGFPVYELDWGKWNICRALWILGKIFRLHNIEVVNTHSSKDAWLGGIAARLFGKKVVRTRHLSTSIRAGINSFFLYRLLADFVATTSSCIIPIIQKQALQKNILCVPTGVDPEALKIRPEQVAAFRKALLKPGQEFLIGSVCVVRSWKGIGDLMQAAQLVKQKNSKIHWVVVGGGYIHHFAHKVEELGIQDVFTFVGHLEDPYPAIAALDLFLLLSTASEGISQASLQAAFLERPLITSSVGGLPEVCIDGKTGRVVPPCSPEQVADAVLHLMDHPEERRKMGACAKELVQSKFLFSETLDKMEQVYHSVL